ncbi:MAG: class 1 fructose-bisphosphatase, partial [Aurantimonas coralicida]|nr:class 1 fructose-bisphosphatase [Aurantimonas coralicida]
MSSSLDAHLGSECGSDPIGRQVADTIRQLCAASIKLRNTIIAGGVEARSGGGDTNAGGDVQKP